MLIKLKEKPLIINFVILLLVSVSAGFLLLNFSTKTLNGSLEQTLQEVAKQGAGSVSRECEAIKNILNTIAASEKIKNPYESVDEKQRLLQSEAQRNGFLRLSLSDKSGIAFNSDGITIDISDRDYYTEGMKNKQYITDPFISKVDGKEVIVISVPVRSGSDVVNVLFATLELSKLNEIIKDIGLGTEGSSFISNNEGYVIAHSTGEFLGIKDGEYTYKHIVGSVSSLLSLEKKIITNHAGVDLFKFNNVKRLAAYYPIKGANWFLVVTCPQHLVYANIHDALLLFSILIGIILLGFYTILIYNNNLRGKLVMSNAKLAVLFDELSDSEEKLKKKYSELSKNQEKMKKNEEIYGFIISATRMGIWDYDALEKKSFFSPEIQSMFPHKINKSSNIFNSWREIIIQEDLDMVISGFRDSHKNKDEFFECEARYKDQFDEIRWIYLVCKILWDNEGNPIRYAGSVTDITQKKQYEERIKKMAYFDSLTGLPNRVQFRSYVDKAIENNNKFAVIFVDIDNFKYINDSVGHSFGDNIIVEVGNRIKSITQNGMVARLGGDELIICLDNIEGRNEIIEYADQLLKILYISFCVSGITMNVSVSVGIAIFPYNGADFEELLKNADTAMYRSKTEGKNRYSFFESSMNTELYQKMKLEGLLREAIAKNELKIYYQPQYDLSTGRISGFEALLRWFNCELGSVSPGEFIPIAEQTGIIISLGEWILQNACEFIERLSKLGYVGLTICVNVSAVQLKQEDFIEMLKRCLEHYNLGENILEIEITESIMMESMERYIKVIHEVEELGVRVALDDFGTGYSSLTCIKELPIHTLKIDKSFIKNIADNRIDKDIAGLIVNLAHSLGLKVVAEGVETIEQRISLEECCCDVVQGYLYSPAIIEESAIEILKEDCLSPIN